jgi:hypothetical protein
LTAVAGRLRWLRDKVRRRLVLARLQPARAAAWLGDRRWRTSLNELSEDRLRRRRRSESVFVFGSGASLNEIAPEGWAEIARHDTIGFNYFSRQRFVRVDYHLVGEISTTNDLDRSVWLPAVREYTALIADNPQYRETVLGLQEGWTAFQSNRLVSERLIPAERGVFRYRRVARGVFSRPSASLRDGLVHGAGSLISCVNLAYALGWKEIVLAGVDLYDSRYFWLPESADRDSLQRVHGIGRDDPHPTARAMVEYLGRWASLLAPEGVRLAVENPRSLLADALPVRSVSRSAPATGARRVVAAAPEPGRG